jgi:hypothetical protein
MRAWRVPATIAGGYEHMSPFVPTEVAAIEALMREPRASERRR